ncbi:MAG: LLM class flavin-dependent oxidoreductase [Acidimicrobiales bacterium]
MLFGLTVSSIDDVGLIAHAEHLGYDFCWVPDTQLLTSNPWAVLALAAQQTQRIRIGTGLAVAGLRLAPVLANSIATINRLAPGRTFCGVGTGNTAMRTMGRRPMAVKPFAEYLRVVRALLDGEEVEYRHGDSSRPIRFQNRNPPRRRPRPHPRGRPGAEGAGPRRRAGRTRLVTSVPRGGTAEARGRAEAAASTAGRNPAEVEVYALMNLLLLEPGETLASPRAIAECGSAIMANVHYLVDLHRETAPSRPPTCCPSGRTTSPTTAAVTRRAPTSSSTRATTPTSRRGRRGSSPRRSSATSRSPGAPKRSSSGCGSSRPTASPG